MAEEPLPRAECKAVYMALNCRTVLISLTREISGFLTHRAPRSVAFPSADIPKIINVHGIFL